MRLAIVGAVVAVALMASLLATPIARAAAIRWRVLDYSVTGRSSHSGVTPRGGGIAVLLAAAVGLAVARREWLLERSSAALLVGGLLLAAAGLFDDRYRLPVTARLGVQFLVAGLVVAALGPLERLPLPAPLALPLGIAAVPLTLLWIVAVANFYNFMDGIDGLAGLQGVVTGLVLAAADWNPFSTVTAAALAGGCAGFLRSNWAPARIFMGDVGSVPLGFAFASLPLLAPQSERGPAVLLAALSLWFFLADASWTLLNRLARGERWSEAHREHLYQRLAIAWQSHARVSIALAAGATALALLGLQAYRSHDVRWIWSALALASVLFAFECYLAGASRRRLAAA